MSTNRFAPTASAAMLMLFAASCAGSGDELHDAQPAGTVNGFGGSAQDASNQSLSTDSASISASTPTVATSNSGSGGVAPGTSGSSGSGEATASTTMATTGAGTNGTAVGSGGATASTGVETSRTSDASGGTSVDTAVATSGASEDPSGSFPEIPVPSSACPEFVTGSQTILGLETDMLVGTPNATKGPLLFTWHGTASSGNTALNFQLPSSVRNSISELGGIIVAPNDNLQVREGNSANGVWYETSDLEYADHIVACAVENHNVDPRRIYVTGCSAGGLMAGAMAVARSSYVAAIAPNSGGIVSFSSPSLEDPSHVPAVMNMHGGAGDNVVINFGQTSATLADFITSAGGFAVDCDHSSGHCGAPGELTESAWEFMMKHPFGTAPSPYESGLPASFPSYCEIW